MIGMIGYLTTLSLLATLSGIASGPITTQSSQPTKREVTKLHESPGNTRTQSGDAPASTEVFILCFFDQQDGALRGACDKTAKKLRNCNYRVTQKDDRRF